MLACMQFPTSLFSLWCRLGCQVKSQDSRVQLLHHAQQQRSRALHPALPGELLFDSQGLPFSAHKCFLTRSCTVQGKVAWHRLFTQRLSSDVLLVGPTVSCEGTPNRLNMSELRQNPHVQSFVLATNRVCATKSSKCSAPSLVALSAAWSVPGWAQTSDG